MNKNEYNNILIMIKNKINFLDNLKKEKKISIEEYETEKENLEEIYKLVENPYHSFFSEIDFNTALLILTDIGIKKDELISVYKKLIEEDINNKYVLIDEKNISFD